jgi:ACS family tartrate transporter-like MFS transporter
MGLGRGGPQAIVSKVTRRLLPFLAILYVFCLIDRTKVSIATLQMQPGFIIAALALQALGERIGAGSYWALTTNLLGPRAAAGGIAMINSVGNLGGFFGPKLMGFLVGRSGSHTVGLFTAAGPMVVAATLGELLKGQPAYHPAGEPALTDAG